MRQICGDATCRVSSSIVETTTYGSGKLDPYGFWEHPCYQCASRAIALYPDEKTTPRYPVDRDGVKERFPDVNMLVEHMVLNMEGEDIDYVELLQEYGSYAEPPMTRNEAIFLYFSWKRTQDDHSQSRFVAGKVHG